MKFNWHSLVFQKTIRAIARNAGQYKGGLPGWYEWFQSEHPDVYAKYQELEVKMNRIWGKADERSMSEFKKHCASYMETYKWAMSQFSQERQ
ncbi:hypothetical protein H8E50_00090 [bacterium]|nr:hypothetical protein [bacterium]